MPLGTSISKPTVLWRTALLVLSTYQCSTLLIMLRTLAHFTQEQ